MASVNEVRVLGRLGQDPELKMTPSGMSVCNLSLATSFKPKNGEEKTEWHRITVWGKDAEAVAKYLKKGSQAYVSGRLETRQWEKNGEKRYSTEIIADRVQFLDSKSRLSNDPDDGNDAKEPF